MSLNHRSRSRMPQSLLGKFSSRRKEALIKGITTVSRKDLSLFTSAATSYEILQTRSQ